MIRLVQSDFHGGKLLRTFRSADTAARYVATHSLRCHNCQCDGNHIVMDEWDYVEVAASCLSARNGAPMEGIDRLADCYLSIVRAIAEYKRDTGVNLWEGK